MNSLEENSLEDAWNWFESTKYQLQLMRRLAERHPQVLSWEFLQKDDKFKNLDCGSLRKGITHSLQELDDLAVLVLFSAFEAIVRRHVELEVNAESARLNHPTLKAAAEEALQTIREGSFYRVVDSFKSTDPDVVEAVNQVRRYRNWVAHGKRDAPKAQVDPKTAFERLQQFLELLKKPVASKTRPHGSVSPTQ